MPEVVSTMLSLDNLATSSRKYVDLKLHLVQQHKFLAHLSKSKVQRQVENLLEDISDNFQFLFEQH